jgi:hypothetical protein
MLRILVPLVALAAAGCQFGSGGGGGGGSGFGSAPPPAVASGTIGRPDLHLGEPPDGGDDDAGTARDGAPSQSRGAH